MSFPLDKIPCTKETNHKVLGGKVGGILQDLQIDVYSEGTEHRQGRFHYLLSDIKQWYLCPPLLYSKLSMGEYGKHNPVVKEEELINLA